MSQVQKPIILIPELGEQGLLPDGAIINAGGVAGPTFTIDGKAVILADGSASDGSGQIITIGSEVTGYEWIQSSPSLHWIIPHGKGTDRIQVTIWDESNDIIYPDVAKIADGDTVHIIFGTAQAGRAILMLF